MRHCLRVGLVFLLACSNDTFGGDDASPDATADSPSSDSPPPPADSATDALDSFASNIALWFDASDATVNASNVVTEWQTHNTTNLVTAILASSNANTCGGNGIHQTKSAINNHATVTFCNALLTVKDDTSIQLGTKQFLIEVVVRMPVASGGLIITKAPESGAVYPFPTLTFWARDPTSSFDGELSSTENITAPSASSGFQYVGFGRFNGVLEMRVSGQATTAPLGPAVDVSSSGNDYQIGGSVFDTSGNYQNIFTGDLAEIIVLHDATLVMAQGVEAYFKAKYTL